MVFSLSLNVKIGFRIFLEVLIKTVKYSSVLPSHGKLHTSLLKRPFQKCSALRMGSLASKLMMGPNSGSAAVHRLTSDDSILG